MTKADIVNEVAKATGLEKIAVQKVIECFMDSVKNSLEKGDNVYLRGFGSFIVKERAEKTAATFQKTTIVIPAHKIPSFKPRKFLSTRLKTHNNLIKIIKICQAVRKERDIKWPRTNEKTFAQEQTQEEIICC